MSNANTALGIGMIFCILLLIASIPVYFIPSIVAGKKKHKNQTGIFILNLFLGWTLVGWVGALVWAVTETDEEKIETKGNKYEDLEKLQKLKESGAISEEEFNIEKDKILNQ